MSIIAYNRPGESVAGLGTWLAVASGDATYVPSYLYDFTPLNFGFPAKLTIKSAGGWHADFTTDRRVDLMVARSNADEAQTIAFEGHNASLAVLGTTANMTTTLTVPAKREDGCSVMLWKDMRTVTGYLVAGKRYFRYRFPVSGSNNSVNWGLKIWMASTIRDLPGFLQGGKTPEAHLVMRNRTAFGYRQWTYNMEDAPRSWSGTFILSRNSAESTRLLSDLVSLFRSGASYMPFFFVPDTTINDSAFVTIGSLTDQDGISLDQLDITYTSKGINQVNLTLVECGIGGPEWT